MSARAVRPVLRRRAARDTIGRLSIREPKR
jgi:hypothetical protein